MFHDYTLLETNKVIRRLEDDIDHDIRFRSYVGWASRHSLWTAGLDKLGSYGLSKIEKTTLISIYDLTFETKE